MHIETRRMICDAVVHLKDFIYNLLYFAKRSQADNDLAALRNFVLSLPKEMKEQYAEECSYLETMSLDDVHLIMFPYPMKAGLNGKGAVVGKEKGLWYVLHNEKSKLFFPSLSATSGYIGLVRNEGLLGTGWLEKSPHCYTDKNFRVEEGDVLLDLGCAEAIFALDNIEKVSKAYLFECAAEWRKPLQCTFAPYTNKVVFVDKLVSDKTQGKSITLIDALKEDDFQGNRFFVKMDIEGWERTVLAGNRDFFKNHKVKLSCCVYHRQDDAIVIEAMLKGMGYTTRFSDGYMLPTMNGIHYPYFRHGVIYAQNY